MTIVILNNVEYAGVSGLKVQYVDEKEAHYYYFRHKGREYRGFANTYYMLDGAYVLYS